MPLLLQKFIVNQQAVTPQHSLINNCTTFVWDLGKDFIWVKTTSSLDAASPASSMATTLNALLNHGCLVAVPTPMIAGNDQEAPWVTDASRLWSAVTAWSVACSVRTAHGCIHTSSMASSQMMWIRSISWRASMLPKEVAGNFVQLPWMSLPSWWSLTGHQLGGF